MPRNVLRTLTTTAAAMVLLVLTALPALAASGTKPDAAADPYLVGSLEQLVTAAIVGLVMAIIAFVMLAEKGTDAEDDHH